MIYVELFATFVAGAVSSLVGTAVFARRQLRKMMRPQGFPLTRQ